MTMSMRSLFQFITEGRKKTNKEQEMHIEGNSILDKIMNDKETNIDEFVKEFVRPNGPTIYAFTTDKVDSAVKVGYTDQHPESRIAQWKEIYGKEEGEVVTLGWWSSEEFNQAGERVFFWDHAIHKKIRDKGYKQLERDEFMNTLTEKGKQLVDIHYSREFFSKYKKLLQGQLNNEDKEELSGQLLEDLIMQMKANIKAGKADFKLYSFDEEGKTSKKQADKVWGEPDTYSNTDLQEDAIDRGVKAIKNDKKNILMAAVMRFGKTHASYEIVKHAGFKRVIVCSAKADVRTAWREDINHVHFYKDFVFIEVLGPNNWDVTYCKEDKLVTEHGIPNMENLEKSGKTIIYFFTLHDLGGSVKELKEKHKGIFDKEFDMMIVDETHYGSHANTFGKATGLGQNKIKDDEDDEDNAAIEEEQKIAKESKEALQKLNIKYKRVLQVSGTPYYILASNEMIAEDAEIISKVSYTDMLNARDKYEKEHKGEDQSKSPYFGIPTLHKIGLRLNKECRKVMQNAGMTDSMTELFKVDGQKFVHERAVEGLMKSIFGDGKGSLAFLKNKSVEGNKVCKHTLIVLPRVKACRAMKDLLTKFIPEKNRKVFCIVNNWGGIADVKDVDDLNNQLETLDSKGIGSIILTVNRFLTGVSMPCVDSMIYLKNASSPQEYDQNIFRLCTRRVKKVKDPDNESRSKKVNMKDNVYLIDFNMTNMFNMIANSARMKAAAEGNPTTERIKELMEDDVKAVPIFAEDKASSEILGKMHKIDSKDMMIIYSNYNKNKSIADIVSDEIDLFDNLFIDSTFQKIIAGIDIEGDNSKINLGNDEEDSEGLDNIVNGVPSSKDDKKIKSLLDKLKEAGITKKEKKQLEELTKKKFKAITKNLLYCDLCLDEPCVDIDGILKKVKEDKDFKKMLNEFKINENDIETIYNTMSTNFKQAYNSLLTRMALLAQDTSKSGYEKFSKALEGLGRLDKNEVVTPPEIVEKMIDKLSKEDFEKADNILLVNEKQAEFAIGIYNKFGKDILNKVKIVASSEAGKHLSKKMLKSLLGKNYINNIILNINDIDSNGYYDVKDFLTMKNEEILKENNGKKFDICLMNPPYDDGVSKGMEKNLHIKFTSKCIDISYKTICVMPIKVVKNESAKKELTEAKEKYNKSIISIDEIDSKYFKDTRMPNVGIYYFDNSKKENQKIKLNYLSNSFEVDSLLEKTSVNEIEKKILSYLECDKDYMNWNYVGYEHNLDDKERTKQCNNLINVMLNKKRFKNRKINNPVFLFTKAANGGMNATYINNNSIISKDKNELLINLKKRNGAVTTILSFNSIKAAENCKVALQNNVLRLACLRNQVDQNMKGRVYKYIPNIDWSDDRVKTDEGLLEVCGCPKDKCKEYAEYCKKIIEQVDKK